MAGYQAVVDFSGTATFKVDNSYAPGDVNGDGSVNSSDETLLRVLVKPRSRPATTDELRAGDLNGNGLLEYRYLILLKRILAGLPVNIRP